MLSVSQLTIVIIYYISVFGLLICSLLSLLLIDKKRKLLFLFLFFIFTGILSFVYYSGVLFFTVGIIVVLFFTLLYLFVLQMELFGNRIQQETGEKLKNPVKNKILNVIISLLLCAAIGYFIYGYAYDFLKEVKGTEGSVNIPIASLGDISNQLFSDYGLVLIIIIASLFTSFLWFIITRMDKK